MKHAKFLQPYFMLIGTISGFQGMTAIYTYEKYNLLIGFIMLFNSFMMFFNASNLNNHQNSNNKSHPHTNTL